MIYQIKLDFDKPWFVNKESIYYGILWWFLNFFKKQKNIYDSIVKLSFWIWENFTIYVSILWEKNYKLLIDEVLRRKNNSISINWIKFQFKFINFNTVFFDYTKEIENYKNIKKFEIFFLSPTFIRRNTTTYSLPNPEIFLYSAYNISKKLFWLDFDDKLFKDWLKYNIMVWEFNEKAIVWVQTNAGFTEGEPLGKMRK